jgi:prepilin-type N-terminal cleavage/methylation domain-containing protein
MNAAHKSEAGFTIIEVIVAIMVLTVGLLGLVTTAALVTRMIGQGQRSAVAGTFAAQRMERLRIAACIPAQRVPGGENLLRGSVISATNTWTFTAVTPVLVGGTSFWKINLTTTYKTVQNRTRTERMESTVIC